MGSPLFSNEFRRKHSKYRSVQQRRGPPEAPLKFHIRSRWFLPNVAELVQEIRVFSQCPNYLGRNRIFHVATVNLRLFKVSSRSNWVRRTGAGRIRQSCR